MNDMLSNLVDRLGAVGAGATRIIPWGSPVPAFGNLRKSIVATVGLNPSNREFVDDAGLELDGPSRRLHTLKSLELTRWSEATSDHLGQIGAACRDYFSRNPYNGWFRSLDAILSAAGSTYYGDGANACHLDLIPYATECKWTELTSYQRSALIAFAGDALAYLLRDAPIRIILLNGKTVVENLQNIAGVTFDRVEMRGWTLPRQGGSGVIGYAFHGTITHLAGIDLGRPILVLGFNHNIQSSFGVTTQVKSKIRRWFATVTKEVGLWDPLTDSTGNAFAKY